LKPQHGLQGMSESGLMTQLQTHQPKLAVKT